MKIPFEQIEWQNVSTDVLEGTTGTIEIKKRDYNGFMVRILKCSPNFKLDHWCSTGHIAYCLEGECTLNTLDGKSFTLIQGSSFVVSDNEPAHDLISHNGATLFVIDGDFLGDT